MHYNLPELWRPQNCLLNSVQFWTNWNLLMFQCRKSSHLPIFHFSLKFRALVFPLPVVNSQKRGKQNTHLRCSFSENVEAVQNLVFYTIRALACWTETPPLNNLLSQHCGSQNPVSSRKSRSPVKSKDEQWKFRILTAAIAIFKVLKVIYKPLRQVETTLSPFFFFFFLMSHEEVQWTHISTDWPCLGSQKLRLGSSNPEES